MILAITDALPFRFGWPELALVALSTAIIFFILGPRLYRDLRRRR